MTLESYLCEQQIRTKVLIMAICWKSNKENYSIKVLIELIPSVYILKLTVILSQGSQVFVSLENLFI